ncbi:hypothetical protein Abr02nite_04430 [Paractinoplanes brasiliensis]|nr:hypothetical protein Abr02nite_04430 [Actinoplanes brasiliensis]
MIGGAAGHEHDIPGPAAGYFGGDDGDRAGVLTVEQPRESARLFRDVRSHPLASLRHVFLP